jgi:hypothetical protein
VPAAVHGERRGPGVQGRQQTDRRLHVRRGDLGGPIYAQACNDTQLGEAWAVNRGSYNGTDVVWFTSYYFNVNVDVYHDRRDPGAPIIAYRPYPPIPTINELMREQ